MPYTITFLEHKQIVVIENTGRLTYDDFSKQSEEALQYSREKNTGLFLSDCTSMISDAKTLELFDFPSLYERIEAPRTNKVAVLMSRDAATNKDIQFYETVCRNRGWRVKVFDSRDAAIKWLLG